MIVRESDHAAVPEPLCGDERVDLVRFLRAPASAPRVECLPWRRRETLACAGLRFGSLVVLDRG